MGEVVYPQMVTRHDLPATRIIENAPRDMTGVIIVGTDSDGDFYFASSFADGADALWWLEVAKKKLLEAGGF